jgi:hypothetical protein
VSEIKGRDLRGIDWCSFIDQTRHIQRYQKLFTWEVNFLHAQQASDLEKIG